MLLNSERSARDRLRWKSAKGITRSLRAAKVFGLPTVLLQLGQGVFYDPWTGVVGIFKKVLVYPPAVTFSRLEAPGVSIPCAQLLISLRYLVLKIEQAPDLQGRESAQNEEAIGRGHPFGQTKVAIVLPRSLLSLMFW